MYISTYEVQEGLLVDSENGATVVGCFLQLFHWIEMYWSLPWECTHFEMATICAESELSLIHFALIRLSKLQSSVILSVFPCVWATYTLCSHRNWWFEHTIATSWKYPDTELDTSLGNLKGLQVKTTKPTSGSQNKNIKSNRPTLEGAAANRFLFKQLSISTIAPHTAQHEAHHYCRYCSVVAFVWK